MMLFKLSVRNLKKSLKDYMIYFVTLIIGVAVFYVFNAMEDQTVMLTVSETKYEVLRLMNNMMSALSVFVSFILGFLIVYASNFLLKRRKKEFGIYMLLGMGKRRISTILLVETVLLGLVSLAVGLFAGIVFSQGMSVVVADLFEADMARFSFIVSGGAIGKTILYFLVMYLTVLLLNTIVVGRARLIELLHAGKKSQKVRLRNPWVCVILFFAAVVILADAYYNVTSDYTSITSEAELMLEIAKGILGTFLVFWSLAGLLLLLAQKSKRLYYKKIHMFTVKELASRINTTVFSGSIICLMLFVTICVLSAAMSIKKAVDDNLKTQAPAEVNFYHYAEDQETEMYHIRDVFAAVGVDEGWFRDIVDIDTYASTNLTFMDTLGNRDDMGGEFADYARRTIEEVIYVSDYNRAAKLYHLKQLVLEEDEYAVICNVDAVLEMRNQALGKGTVLTFGDRKYHPGYQECQDGFLTMASNNTNFGFIVVPDSADLSAFYVKNNYYLANYAADNDKEREKIEACVAGEKLRSQLNPPDKTWEYVTLNTRQEIYDNAVGLTALVIFIGIYLGIVFMISGAAILALKELSETSDSREKYQILRRIGVDEKMIRGSLFYQCLIFFAMPLILAVIHSIFGIQVSLYILETFGKTGLLFSIIVTALIILAVYGVYFLITYLCSRRIISE